MKRFAFIIYRTWAYEIYKNIVEFQKQYPQFVVDTLITIASPDFVIDESLKPSHFYVVEGNDNARIAEILKENEIDVASYYSWSWIVKEPILSRYICLCLHPSPLPEYRGGSPIQNQIVNGETVSAVSIFRMGAGIDDGDIYRQVPISFEGNIKDIFARMAETGTAITKQFIRDLANGQVTFTPQRGLVQNPPLNRRKSEQSEIPLDRIAAMKYMDLYNRVRSLTDPYPNAYIVSHETLDDGAPSSKKVFLREIQKCEILPAGIIALNDNGPITPPLYLRVADGYALIKD